MSDEQQGQKQPQMIVFSGSVPKSWDEATPLERDAIMLTLFGWEIDSLFPKANALMAVQPDGWDYSYFHHDSPPRFASDMHDAWWIVRQVGDCRPPVRFRFWEDLAQAIERTFAGKSGDAAFTFGVAFQMLYRLTPEMVARAWLIACGYDPTDLHAAPDAEQWSTAQTRYSQVKRGLAELSAQYESPSSDSPAPASPPE